MNARQATSAAGGPIWVSRCCAVAPEPLAGGLVHGHADTHQCSGCGEGMAISRGFGVGDTLTLLNPAVGIPCRVNYRGKANAAASVVILDGLQMTVSTSWLSKLAPP